MTPEVQQLDASLLRIGQEFAGYRVEAGLGRQSGVGRVYEATHLASDRRVALKVFSPQALRDSALLDRFTDTAGRQSRLRHDSVVKLEEWGLEPAPYMAMTLVRGPTLADLFEQGGVDDARALRILDSVAAGLEAGRRRGLVYRRLQPQSVLVDVEAGDRAYLADFGAARPGRSSASIETHRLGAFVDYISPEEADDGEATGASVVYSLGAMLFEALTGRPPYAAEAPWSTLRAHLEAPPRGPHAVRPELPEELDPVIERALAKDPSARQASPSALMREVDRAYPAETRAGGGADRPRRRRRGRLPMKAVGLVALVVAVGGALGALAAAPPGGDSGPRPPKRLDEGSLRLRYPADWTATGGASRVPGVRLAHPVSVSSPDSLGGGELVAGQIVGGRLPANGQVVDLAGVTAKRYTGLRDPRSSRQVELYAVPALGGDVVAACFQDVGSDRFAGRCRRAASTLRPRRPGARLSAASPAYARALGGVVGRVGRVRRSGRARLARARTPAGQRRAAGRLGRDYRRLARVLAGIDAPQPARPAHRLAVAQLRRAGRGFSDMARAARAHRGGAWVRARRGVRSAEGRFQGALKRLRKLGYDVR